MALLTARLIPIISTQHSIHPVAVDLLALFDQLAAPTYSLVLWVTLLFVRSPASHRRLVWHLFTISGLAAIHEYLFVIGPSLVLTGTRQSTDWSGVSSLSLVVLVCLASGTTRTGPEVFRERSRLYTPAVTNKLKEVGEPVNHNVIGSGDSILGSYFSLSTFRLMRQIYDHEQVDAHELPVVPASMQGEPTTIALEPQPEDSPSRLGHTWYLLFQVVRPNLILFLKRKSIFVRCTSC